MTGRAPAEAYAVGGTASSLSLPLSRSYLTQLGGAQFPFGKPDEMNVSRGDPETGRLAKDEYWVHPIKSIGQEQGAAA
jgi:hypothetical protein